LRILDDGPLFEVPPAWAADALCAEPAYASRADELFFAKHGTTYQDAAAICARCLVRTECLDYALERRIEHGMWGGLSPQQRTQLIRAREPAARRRPITKLEQSIRERDRWLDPSPFDTFRSAGTLV
jgi:WhiB family transcriptional regulator, redox-sensing transcriptional regulator